MEPNHQPVKSGVPLPYWRAANALKELYLATDLGGETRNLARAVAAREEAAKAIVELARATCLCGEPVTTEERCVCGACPTCCTDRCAPDDVTGRSDCGRCGSDEDVRRDEPADSERTLGLGR